MQKTTKDAAEQAIETLSLGEKNRAFVGYWLSLWQGDALPERERFDLMQLKALAPGMMMFDVLPQNRVAVAQAGIDVCRAVGEPLDGIDWVARSVIRNRGVRMRNFSGVAEGSLLVCRRTFRLTTGRLCANEELILPFATRPDGTTPVMAYTDWKIDISAIRSIAEISQAAPHHKVLPLRRRRAPCTALSA